MDYDLTPLGRGLYDLLSGVRDWAGEKEHRGCERRPEALRHRSTPPPSRNGTAASRCSRGHTADARASPLKAGETLWRVTGQGVRTGPIA
ncbi:hypothetical protein [Streptomyces sp. NPDC059743]|uniref:hypothetical protein n=1 Tax=Streptomyces sp. NPDC059743 TaxID=3346928 RepID=UPI0036531748